MISPSVFDHDFLATASTNEKFTAFFSDSRLNIQNKNSLLISHASNYSSLQFFLHKLIVEYLTDLQGIKTAYLELLLNCLLREISQAYILDRKEENDSLCANLPITQIIEYLSEHLATATLESTALHFHYTPRYLTSYLAQYANQSFSKLIKEMKLVKTCEYLRYSNISLGEIAEKVGYNNSGYLNKLFKERYGLSLSRYRSTLKKL